MKKFYLAIVLAHSFLIGKAQNNADTQKVSKPVLSIGADLVPIAFVDGISNLGFGGSLGLELISTPKTSLMINAGYLLFANYPGTYSGHSDDLEFIPLSLTLRNFTNRHFYLGPKFGINIDVAKPEYGSPAFKTIAFYGGLSFGIRSKQRKFSPDFSLLYHNTSYGSIFSLQASLRLQFLGQRNR